MKTLLLIVVCCFIATAAFAQVDTTAVRSSYLQQATMYNRMANSIKLAAYSGNDSILVYTSEGERYPVLLRLGATAAQKTYIRNLYNAYMALAKTYADSASGSAK